MEIYDENENVNLKSSDYRKRNKEKKYLKKKPKIYNVSFIIIPFIIIIIIIIILYNRKLNSERNYFGDVINNLVKVQEMLTKNNSILEKERNYYKNISDIYLNRLNYMKNNSNDKEYKIVAISYGNDMYTRQLEFNGKSALEIAKVDEFYGYTPKDIDEDFKNKNKYILEKGRGNGYWLWKPYFLYKTLMEKLDYGDYLIYSDAAILYIDSAKKLVEFLKERNAEMYLHRLPHLEKAYTKRDAFILLGVDLPFYAETGQFNAAFQIYRKSKFTEFFLKEYLYYAQDKRIITDDMNVMGVDNYEGFIAHRHDQSILSLLTKKYGQVNANKTNLDLELIKNFSEVMPTIFCHYRQRGFDDYEGLKNMCKETKGDI